MSRGLDRERDVRDLLESWGWVAFRVAGSKKLDVVGLLPYGGGYPEQFERWIPATEFSTLPFFIEVKSSARSAFSDFPPAERRALLALAQKAEATPLLAWWPPVSPGIAKISSLVWIPESEWP